MREGSDKHVCVADGIGCLVVCFLASTKVAFRQFENSQQVQELLQKTNVAAMHAFKAAATATIKERMSFFGYDDYRTTELQERGLEILLLSRKSEAQPSGKEWKLSAPPQPEWWQVGCLRVILAVHRSSTNFYEVKRFASVDRFLVS